MKIYISGPITNWPSHRENFANAELALCRLGENPVNPLEVGVETCICDAPETELDREMVEIAGMSNGHLWHCWIKADLDALRDCQAIALLPGWNGSKGAQVELAHALRWGHQIWVLRWNGNLQAYTAQ